MANINLSGLTLYRNVQYETFEESSYEGNPLLSGPQHNNSNEIGLQSLMPNVSNNMAEEDGFIDMGAFYGGALWAYKTVLLGILVVLCINPRWRLAWFYLIEVCMKESYYFVVNKFPKLSKFSSWQLIHL